jgi:hypothetical protein
MSKAVDKDIQINNIRLLYKNGATRDKYLHSVSQGRQEFVFYNCSQ